MVRIYLAGPPFADEYRTRAAALVRAAGMEPVDPMRRDFRGATAGREAEIVEGDLADIDSCTVVLASFTAPDEGTAMEAWYAHSLGKPVIAYTGGTPPHPWAVYVAREVHADLDEAIRALARTVKPQIGLKAIGDYETRSPARIVIGRRFGGVQSGHAQRGSYEQLGL